MLFRPGSLFGPFFGGTEDNAPPLPPGPITPFVGSRGPILFYPAYSDKNDIFRPVFVGPGFHPNFPIANLQHERLSKFARSMDLSYGNTWFDCNLTRLCNVIMFVLPKTNLSPTSTIRVTGSNNFLAGLASPVFQTAWLQGDTSDLTQEDRIGLSVPTEVLLPNFETINYFRVEIRDGSNPDGYIQLHRFLAAGAWEPINGQITGAKLGQSFTTVKKTLNSGTVVAIPKPAARTYNFTPGMMEEAEAFTKPWRLLRTQGLHKQIWVKASKVGDPHWYERSFLATLEEASTLDFPNPLFRAMNLSLKEVI